MLNKTLVLFRLMMHLNNLSFNCLIRRFPIPRIYCTIKTKKQKKKKNSETFANGIYHFFSKKFQVPKYVMKRQKI